MCGACLYDAPLLKQEEMPKYNIEVEFLGKKYRANNVVAKSFEDAVTKVKNTFKVTGGQEVEEPFPEFNKLDIQGSFEELVDFLHKQSNKQ